MKSLKTAALAAALAALATGCATVSYSSPGMLKDVSAKGIVDRSPEQQIVISTIGYYVLWTVPLVSGDLRWDPDKQSIKGGFSLFRDQVGINELQTALLKIAESRDCDLADVEFADADSSYAGASGTSGLLGIFFGSSQMGVSALLVPRDKAE